MTRFPRRATVLAAVLLAAPLGFALNATAAAAAPAAAQAVNAAGQAVTVAGQALTAADLTAVVSKKKKKKKKTTTAKKPVTTPTKTTPAVPVTKPVESGSLESEVVTLTNTYRVANGCGAMRIDTRLVAAARAHSTDMVTKDFFSHTGSNGSTFVQREVGAGYSTGASAENIAWGYQSPKEVVDGWIASPGHKANILNCGSVAVGVGLAYKADGTPYWTQDFGRV